MIARKPIRSRLIDAAAAPYRAAGRFAWHFARGKLGGDPAFTGLLERGLIPDGERLLDLGCGQGLLASWLLAARAQFDAADWPSSWPAPPRYSTIAGVELMPRDVDRARAALGDAVDVVAGDIRSEDFGRANAIVILDVLHYIGIAEQDEILRRARDALVTLGFRVEVIPMSAGTPFANVLLVARL